MVPDVKVLLKQFDFLGNTEFFLFHSTCNAELSYTLAEHVNTALNGAAALMSVGWDITVGAGSV